MKHTFEIIAENTYPHYVKSLPRWVKILRWCGLVMSDYFYTSCSIAGFPGGTHSVVRVNPIGVKFVRAFMLKRGVIEITCPVKKKPELRVVKNPSEKTST